MSEPAAPTLAAAARSAYSERLSFGTIVAYSLPLSGTTLVGIVFGMYFAKFGTDVLLVAPGWIGALLGASRLWDAVTDPGVGYLSDHTRSRWGRRRPWMGLSAIPLGACVVMLWAPPSALTGLALVAWLAVALLVYEAVQTAFIVPYGALGVELTNDYHERTRLFGYRHIFGASAPLLGLVAFSVLIAAEDKRAMALDMSLAGGAILAATILYAAWKLRERPGYQGRAGANPFRAFGDVFRNRHARLLLVVFGIDTLGASAILMLIPFFTQYVLQSPELAVVMLACYLVPSFGLTPLWIVLARRYSKKSLWMSAMAVTVIGFFAQTFITTETLALAYILPAFLGIGAGLGAVVAPAVMADVIDYDEYLTGERKEGSYLAVWNLVRKGASAVMPALGMALLQGSGYAPNVEQQSEETLLVLRGLVGIVPAAFFAIGLLLFSRFGFNEREYAEVRSALDDRAAAAEPRA